MVFKWDKIFYKTPPFESSSKRGVSVTITSLSYLEESYKIIHLLCCRSKFL